MATADAGLFAEVVKRALASREGDATIILSRAGLSDLFVAEARNTIEAAGGRVVTGAGAEALVWEGNRVTGVMVARERVDADVVISAVPWHALRRLVPAESELGRRVGLLRGAPIVSVALWFDRPVMGERFAGFVESPVHWVFDASRLHGDGVLSRVNLTISAADAWAGLASDDIVARVLAECRKHLPAAADAQVRHAFVHKARDATLRAVPESAPLRPGVASGWEGLLLAGDWTETGLPSTIEGAMLSGRRAAEAVG